MPGEPRRVSGECMRALRWDEGGEPPGSCSEGTGEMQHPGEQSPRQTVATILSPWVTHTKPWHTAVLAFPWNLGPGWQQFKSWGGTQ